MTVLDLELVERFPPGPQRLDSLKVFVGGPIKAAFVNGAFDTSLRHRVDTVVRHLRDAGADVLSAHHEEGFQPLPHDAYDGIVSRDHGWLRQCDVYVPLLPLGPDGALLPSVGTGVEIGWATLLGKPVLLLVETDRLDCYSPFLRGLPAAFRAELMDLDEAVESPGALRTRLLELRRKSG